MTDEQKKLVTEWLGECWHELKSTFDGHPPVCSCNGEETIYSYLHSNRTFTTDSDFFACFNRLVELGEWKEFRDHYLFINNDDWAGEDFDIWYHGKLPDGTYRLCKLCAEWVEKGE